jgi:hypothetical protein
MNTSQDAARQQQDGGGTAEPAGTSAPPARGPVQSSEDTDAGWGEVPEPDDDRLFRDRPPHWDDV